MRWWWIDSQAQQDGTEVLRSPTFCTRFPDGSSDVWAVGLRLGWAVVSIVDSAVGLPRVDAKAECRVALHHSAKSSQIQGF